MEAMAASVKLTLESNIAAGVTEAADALRRFDSQLGDSQGKLNALGDVMDRIARGATAFDKMARAVTGVSESSGRAAEGMERVAQAVTGIDGKAGAMTDIASAMRGMSGATGAAGNIDAVATALGRVAHDADALERAAAAVKTMSDVRAPGAGAGGAAGHGGASDPAIDGMGASMVASGAAAYAAHMLHSGVDAAVSVQTARAGLLGQGWTATQADDAVERAYKDQQGILGVTVVQALQARGMLKSVFGDVDDANTAAPGLLRLGAVMEKSGHSDILAAVEASAQAGELKGLLTDPATGRVDSTRLVKFAQDLMVLDQATDHRLGPKELLSFGKNAGVAGTTLSDPEQFGREVVAMLSLGPRQAGTALQGFARQWSAGRMSKAAAYYAADLGIIKPGDWKPAGIGAVWIDQKALPVSDMMANPSKYVDEWNEKIHKFDMKKFGYDDPALRGAAWMRLSSSVTGSKFAGDMARNEAMQQKYAEVFATLHDLDFYDIKATQDPAALEAGFGASVTAAQARSVSPVMGEYTRLLQHAKAVADAEANVAAAHPGIAAAAVNLGAIGAGALGGAGVGGMTGAFIIPGLGAPAGAAIGAAVGGGSVLAAEISTLNGSAAIREQLRKQGGADLPGFHWLWEQMRSLFPQSGDGRLQVSLPDKPIPVTINDEDSFVRKIEHRIADWMNAPPSTPGGVDDHHGGLHPGQHN